VRRSDGLYRIVISVVYNLLFRMMFGLRYRDINSKPKILRRSQFEKMHLTSEDWFIDAEIMIRAGEMGLKVAEIPIHFYNLSGRASFVKPRAILEFMKNLWNYRRRYRKH
jgi:hypothetical protein